MKIDWQWKTFKQINGPEMHAILALRQNIFMLEQQSLYQDIDDIDKISWHLIAKDTNLNIIAYARVVYSDLKNGQLSIGRILISKTFRKQGLGRILIDKCIERCQQEAQVKIIKVSAQTHLIQFYNMFGFTETGECYDDGGIEHIDMERSR